MFLGSKEDRHLSRPQLVAQLHLLGKIKGREWAALFGVLVFTLGVATAAIHKVPPPWVALTILYTLLLFGFLRKREFKEKIDWPFLVYLGGLAAITAGFNAVGLNTWLAGKLSGIGGLLQGNLELFLLVLFGVVFLIRLVVPISATIVIAAAVFMPLADVYGTNSWVVGMAVLVLGEMWFFPYQCSYYMQFRNSALKQPGYNEKTFLLYNALMNLVKLAALYASIPYWKWLGLL
jgi:di/tricarboxylate transporter